MNPAPVGVMRGREFYMKDGYNFDLTKEDALHAYNRHLVSYLRTYERMGLQAIPMRADSGPIGGDDTHEFLVLADTGESEVFYDSAVTDLTFGDREIEYDSHAACQAILDEFTSKYARTDETHDEALFNQIPEERRRVARGIEVGQISISAPSIPNRLARRCKIRTATRCGPYGQPRHRRLAPSWGDHRGQP